MMACLTVISAPASACGGFRHDLVGYTMSLPVWPPTLPQEPFAGLGEEYDASFLETSMDSGPKKRRRHTTRTPSYQTTPIEVTGTQKAVLDTFYEETLNGGVLNFEWKDMITGATTVFRFTKRPALKLSIPGPKSARLNRRYVGTLELEKM